MIVQAEKRLVCATRANEVRPTIAIEIRETHAVDHPILDGLTLSVAVGEQRLLAPDLQKEQAGGEEEQEELASWPVSSLGCLHGVKLQFTEERNVNGIGQQRWPVTGDT